MYTKEWKQRQKKRILHSKEKSHLTCEENPAAKYLPRKYHTNDNDFYCNFKESLRSGPQVPDNGDIPSCVHWWPRHLTWPYGRCDNVASISHSIVRLSLCLTKSQSIVRVSLCLTTTRPPLLLSIAAAFHLSTYLGQCQAIGCPLS